MQKIILADNQALTKAGWIYLLNNTGSKLTIIEVEKKKDLISEALSCHDAVVILDYNNFDFESVQELLNLKERFPKSSWILCSDSLREELIRMVIYESDTISILMKDSPAEDLQSALKQCIRGERYISSYVSNLLFETSKSRKAEQVTDNRLTQTEKEILREMALGKSTREIANQRHASIHTIMTHRKNIFRKIEVNNVYEATKYAMRAGLIDMAEYYI